MVNEPTRLHAMSDDSIRWVGVAIDCADAGPVARFYEALLGLTVHAFEPPGWAQLFDPDGGVHLNIQGDHRYEPPTWPEQPGEQAKMLHFEVEVDNLEAAVATAVAAGGTEAPLQPPDRNRDRIRVMLDPAGHPLCLFLRGE
jgi:catechol 2,3-dioxygenase-like lactoylglutathione lyase family enzyme